MAGDCLHCHVWNSLRLFSFSVNNTLFEEKMKEESLAAVILLLVSLSLFLVIVFFSRIGIMPLLAITETQNRVESLETLRRSLKVTCTRWRHGETQAEPAGQPTGGRTMPGKVWWWW